MLVLHFLIVMLNVIILNVIMLNVIMLNVIMLNVIMLNVVAPLLLRVCDILWGLLTVLLLDIRSQFQ
jgi:hypothetical protein